MKTYNRTCGDTPPKEIMNDQEKNEFIRRSRKTMTVGELIEKLHTFPKDATITVYKRYAGCGFSDTCCTYCSDNGKEVFIEG